MRYFKHSVNDIKLYGSNIEQYKDLIMIRNIKRKMTLKYSNEGYEHETQPNTTIHHIILGLRPENEIIIGVCL